MATLFFIDIAVLILRFIVTFIAISTILRKQKYSQSIKFITK